MCDTIVATPDVTRDGVMLFGKNSDREPNEAHQVVNFPAADHKVGERLKCTEIEIPQVKHTYAVLLAKPFWIWGAEMGANEHGLVIGNEALFTRIPYAKTGLLGMDLLRLALERARTSREGVQVITDLLAEFGQGGNHGLAHTTYYHNSYILADPKEAWVLETAGPHWAAKKVQGVYTISNGITIDKEWDLASSDLVTYAVTQGWCKGESDFSFSRCYSDFLYTRFSDCRKRRTRSLELLTARSGRITLADLMQVLRDHGQADGSQRPADESLSGADICMHAGFGPIRISQTTGSMVSLVDAQYSLHFVTATAAPCTSIFKPVWIDTPLPDMGPAPSEKYDPKSLFWQHEVLHRLTLHDHEKLVASFASDRDRLEQEFIAEAEAVRKKDVHARAGLSAKCFEKANRAEAAWLEGIAASSKRQKWLHARAWEGFNREADVNLEQIIK